MAEMTAKERAILQERLEIPKADLLAAQEDMKASVDVLRTLGGMDWSVFGPFFLRMAEEATEASFSALGTEAICRLQGQAQTWKYLAALPESLKREIAEGRNRIDAANLAIEEVLADAGQVTGEEAA